MVAVLAFEALDESDVRCFPSKCIPLSSKELVCNNQKRKHMNKKAAASSKLRLQVADDWGAERAGEPRNSNSNIHPLVFLHICPTGPSSLWSVMTL